MGNVDWVGKKIEQGAREKKNAFIVAIGGLSGAGKTALVEKVAQTLGEAVTFFTMTIIPMRHHPISTSGLKKVWMQI